MESMQCIPEFEVWLFDEMVFVSWVSDTAFCWPPPSPAGTNTHSCHAECISPRDSIGGQGYVGCGRNADRSRAALTPGTQSGASGTGCSSGCCISFGTGNFSQHSTSKYLEFRRYHSVLIMHGLLNFQMMFPMRARKESCAVTCMTSVCVLDVLETRFLE